MIEIIAKKIQALIDEKGLNMKSLSAKAGLGETAVRDIIKRSKMPKTSTLNAIAKALDVEVSDLLTDPKSTNAREQNIIQKRKNEAIGIKLKGLRVTENWSQQELAEEAELPLATITDLENGIVHNEEDIYRLAAVFSVDPSHILTGFSQYELSSIQNENRVYGFGITTINDQEFTYLPRFDASLSAGTGSIVDPYAEPIGVHMIETQWLRSVTRASHSDLVVVKVDGDSMEPTLHNGDWVLIDRSQTRMNREGIYALNVEDACWIKRISLDIASKSIRIISDNAAYREQILSENDISVIGRAILVVARRL